MEEKIERILRLRMRLASEMKSDSGDVYLHGYEEAAAEIAKLVDEQLAILAKERDEFEAQALDLGAEYGDELAAKEAQLAEMQEALGLTDALVDVAYETGYYAGAAYQRGEPIKSDYKALATPAIQRRNQLSGEMKKALSAAPEVLHSIEARLIPGGYHVQHGKGDNYDADLIVILEPAEFMTHSERELGQAVKYRKDGQQVRVTITKPSGKNALQAESKAKSKAKMADKDGEEAPL